jgi:hypothetical protein
LLQRFPPDYQLFPKRSDPLCVKEKREALGGVHNAIKTCATLWRTTMTPPADTFHHYCVDTGFMSATASAQLV